MKGVAVSWEGRGTCESVGEHGQYLKLHERSLPKGVLLRAVKVTRKLSHRGHSVTTYRRMEDMAKRKSQNENRHEIDESTEKAEQ
mgnify:CR=1 FL=1